MNSQTLFEIIGYTASVLIAISLMMKSLIRLRIINGIGALVFVVYGFLIKAYPIAFLNALIVVIDLYYLLKMLQRSEYFSLMEVTPDSTYLHFFLDFHYEDIRKFFPSFSYQGQPEDLTCFILRDTIPAGLIIIRPIGNKGSVLLDYALPDYRDFKIGSFIFDDNADILRTQGIDTLEARSEVLEHERYLRQVGFKKIQDGLYQRKLDPHFIQDKEI